MKEQEVFRRAFRDYEPQNSVSVSVRYMRASWRLVHFYDLKAQLMYTLRSGHSASSYAGSESEAQSETLQGSEPLSADVESTADFRATVNWEVVAIALERIP